MSTSEGTPQFPNGISGKLPYHLTSNRNFRIFWPNGKHPSVRENMFIGLMFISFCLHFHCCGSVQVSKFTISRITFAIKRFQEQESKRNLFLS